MKISVQFEFLLIYIIELPLQEKMLDHWSQGKPYYLPNCPPTDLFVAIIYKMPLSKGVLWFYGTILSF